MSKHLLDENWMDEDPGIEDGDVIVMGNYSNHEKNGTSFVGKKGLKAIRANLANQILPPDMECYQCQTGMVKYKKEGKEWKFEKGEGKRHPKPLPPEKVLEVFKDKAFDDPKKIPFTIKVRFGKMIASVGYIDAEAYEKLVDEAVK